MKWMAFVLRAVLAAGIVGILGVAGASDIERIGVWQSVWQLLFCAGASAAAYWGLRVCKARQKQYAQRRVVYLCTPSMRRANSRQKHRVQVQN